LQNGAEMSGKRLQAYRAPGIEVTFDPAVCIHSAVCLKSLPAVFDVRRSRWVRPEAATVAEVVGAIDRCPSGALQYVLEGQAETGEAAAEAAAATTIQASSDGPLLVQGSFRLLDRDGSEIDCAGRTALCRCGSTASQPFCDGSHRRVGFQSKRRPGA
jgi:uncharacterized Fe-S cluster protein YjdI/CDGSH-type Zn-finger protein